MIKKVFCFAVIASSLSLTTQAQEYYDFEQNSFQFGLTVGLGGSCSIGAELYGIDILPSLYVSYDFADWFKVLAETKYDCWISVGEDGFNASHLLRVPVVGLFKVGRGYIGAGVQQNIGLSPASALKGFNLNAFSAVLEFCYFTHWGQSGHFAYYSEKGFHPIIRIGYSINEIGYANNKGHYIFLESMWRWNFLDENSGGSKQKASARRRR
ncbi:MAG: hypothetical protein LBO06_08940 [Bacteroidales bacterium]|jgi:hypothetical protein|nr:hypothetical protein [Bacteroidales bacterium]